MHGASVTSLTACERERAWSTVPLRESFSALSDFCYDKQTIFEIAQYLRTTMLLVA
jgi:hypothetical protein